MKVGEWPKDITRWYEGRIGYMSIPFTWLLRKSQVIIDTPNLFVDQWIVGGPAVDLMPEYLRNCRTPQDGCRQSGVLQRVNPIATRTTVGCPYQCSFCGVGQRKIEGEFRELNDWNDGSMICDNNLLAASDRHFDRVIERLRKHETCDFNQGLDARLLTPHHARQLATLRNPMIRLALDSDATREAWSDAVTTLRAAGIAKRRIRTYALCGFCGSPEQDWERCQWVRGNGIDPLPMWFHSLTAMECNAVSEKQRTLGWTDAKRKQLMGWFYRRRGEPLVSTS